MQGKQMYKIYINKTRVILKSTEKVSKFYQEDDRHTLYLYSGAPSSLLSLIESIEHENADKEVVIHHSDFKKLKADFLSFFKVVVACGGVVVDEERKVLMIYRRGAWDIPKGKMDAGETLHQTALREVEEETGVRNLIISRALGKTKHTYRGHRGRRLIKKTHWYTMHTQRQPLVPQHEEDIEKAEWMTLEQIAKLDPIYPSVRDIIIKYEKRLMHG